MTTQVSKTRSTIVKAVAAAVLLAAGTTTFADTNNNFALETKQVIEVAQTELMSSLNAAIGTATGIEDVNAHLAFAVEHGEQITSQAQAAVNALQADAVTAPASLFNELSAELTAYANAEDKVMFAETDNSYSTILPSIATIGEEYEEKMQRAIQLVALQTLDYTFNVSFADTAEHLE